MTRVTLLRYAWQSRADVGLDDGGEIGRDPGREVGGDDGLEDRLEELPRLRSKKWTRTLSYRRRK